MADSPEATVPQEEVQRLLDEADELPRGKAQVPILEEAVRQADRLQDSCGALKARELLLINALECGAYDKAFVAFTWIRSHWGEDLDAAQGMRFVFYYRWVLSGVPCFASVSREEIAKGLEDFEHCCHTIGWDERILARTRHSVALEMGDFEVADEYLERWRSAPASLVDDCEACDVNCVVWHWVLRDEPERAFAAAGPILRGELTCGSVPGITYGNLLLPALALARIDDAVRFHREGYPLAEADENPLLAIVEHLSFLALTGNHDAASHVFERYLGQALDHRTDDMRFQYWLASHTLMRSLLESDIATRRWKLPADFAGYRTDDEYDIAELERWFDQQAEALACRFDERNGNTRYRDRRNRQSELRALVPTTPIPNSPARPS